MIEGAADKNYHRLLRRQISKYLPKEALHNREILNFIQAVDNAYRGYEEDYSNLERILEISSKESFKELNNLLSAVDQTAAIFMIDIKGYIQSANDLFFQMTQFEKNEVIRKYYKEVFHSPTMERDYFFNRFLTTIKDNNVWKGEVAILGKYGQTIWTNTTIVPIFNNDNIVYKYLFVAYDITELKQTQEQLKTLSLVADETINSVIIANTKFQIEWVNKSFEKTFGYRLNEIKQKQPSEFLLGAETNQSTVQYINQKIAKKKPFECEMICYAKSGKALWINVQIQPLVSDDKEVKQFFCIMHDITESKKSHEIIKLNEEKYRRIIDNVNLGLIEVDPNDIIQFVNNRFLTMTGYTEDELIGHIGKDLLVHEDDKYIISEKNQDRIHGISDAYELKAKTKTGEEKVWLVSGAPNYNAQGQMIGSIGVHIDITQQKKNERDIELFRSLIDSAADALLILDEKGYFIYINQEGLLRLNLTPEKVRHTQLKDIELIFETPANWDSYLELIKQSKDGILLDGINKSQKGKEFPVEIKANYIKVDGKGYVVAASRDITERKIEEIKKIALLEKLEQSNRNLNEFAYVVSHDLKAPLRGIGSLAQWLINDYENVLDDKGNELLRLIELRTKRMHNLIEGVLNYSKLEQDDNSKENINLHILIENVIDSLNPPENIKILVNNLPPFVIFEQVKLSQVFQNLIGNAIKFMDKKKGKIEIGCSEDKLNWQFYIKDNGMGIEDIYFQKIFQIFQTLTPRDEMENTGVGLSIVKKIIEQNGGKIWVESILKKGTTFYFTIPKDQ